MTWGERVKRTLQRQTPEARHWIDSLPPGERALALQALVQLDATVQPEGE